MNKNLIKSAFLSHNSQDKPIVRKIGKALEKHGLKVWIDEAEINIGDSLIEAISEGIESVDCLIAFISKNSIESNWVKKELSLAITKEIISSNLLVIPLVLDNCKVPFFLSDKLYLKHEKGCSIEDTIKKLLKSLKIVFNPNVFDKQVGNLTLNKAIDGALNLGLRILSSPFHRPFQYIGVTKSELTAVLNVKPNEGGNFVLKTELANLFIEMEGNYATYVDVELNQTIPHYLNQSFESESILSALSINPSELEKNRVQTHFHTYYDHSRKLKIGVSCQYDGGPISVGFSKKYYGE